MDGGPSSFCSFTGFCMGSNLWSKRLQGRWLLEMRWLSSERRLCSFFQSQVKHAQVDITDSVWSIDTALLRYLWHIPVCPVEPSRFHSICTAHNTDHWLLPHPPTFTTTVSHPHPRLPRPVTASAHVCPPLCLWYITILSAYTAFATPCRHLSLTG